MASRTIGLEWVNDASITTASLNASNLPSGIKFEAHTAIGVHLISEPLLLEFALDYAMSHFAILGLLYVFFLILAIAVFVALPISNGSDLNQSRYFVAITVGSKTFSSDYIF